MQNDLTKTMPVLICAETCQKDMFLRKYIFGVWPGGMHVALGIICLRLALQNSPKHMWVRAVCDPLIIYIYIYIYIFAGPCAQGVLDHNYQPIKK